MRSAPGVFALPIAVGCLLFLSACGGGGGGSSSGGGALPPAATTQNATGITYSGATLNGAVNPNGTSTYAWFEYGTDPTLSGAVQTTTWTMGSGSSDVPINIAVSGLAAGTTFYFRACAFNAAGTGYGSIASFATGAAATGPTVVSVTPANGTSNVALSTPITATFSASMDPLTIDGSTIRVYSGSTEVTGALAYGTTYQVRISGDVRDAAGTPMGQEYTWQFTTVLAPSGSITGVLAPAGNLAVSYDDATRTATIAPSASFPLDGITVAAVQAGADYQTVVYEYSTVTGPYGTFSFSSLPDGTYFLNTEFTYPAGSQTLYLGLGTASLLGSSRTLSLDVRDVTPTAALNRLDAYCRECHPLVPTLPGQIMSCGHPSDVVPAKANGAGGTYDAYGRVTCRSCHSAHYPTGYLHFVVAEYDPVGTLCLQCH